jgi:hypothetical protein
MLRKPKNNRFRYSRSPIGLSQQRQERLGVAAFGDGDRSRGSFVG